MVLNHITRSLISSLHARRTPYVYTSSIHPSTQSMPSTPSIHSSSFMMTARRYYYYYYYYYYFAHTMLT